MRRLTAASLCLFALACNQPSAPSAVSIPGPNSVAVVGDHLLIASTANDELRALDLTVDPRAFVRAPNPLFPLSIPTAPFPRAVASFTWTETSGTATVRKTAPFAFALSTAGGQVNVISSATLATLGSVVVPDTTLAVAVTKPDAQDERLVLAVNQADKGSLWTARFPEALKDDVSGIAAVQPRLETDVLLGVSSPQALAASPANSDLIAVGDRLTDPDGLGRTGGLAIVDLGKKTVVRLDVGGPVMALAFDQSGNRLFGLLDPDACGSQGLCNGLFRVDLTDPASPKADGFIDVPAVQVQGLAPAVARGLAVGGAIVVTLPAGDTVTVDPLLMVSATDGNLYAYDGARMVPASNPATEAKASVLSYRKIDSEGLQTTNPTDGPQIYAADNTTLMATLDNSAVKTESLTLTWEGALARGRAGRIVGGGLEDPTFDFVAQGVQPGDLVLFGDESRGTCTSTAANVAAVSGSRIELAGLSPECLTPTGVVYAVRAPLAFVANASRSGFLGRVALGSTFSGAGISFVVPETDPVGKPLEPARDTQFVVSLVAAVSNFALPLGTTVMLPGAVAYDPLNMLFYAAYPGGNAIIEIKPKDMRSGDADLGIVAYR